MTAPAHLPERTSLCKCWSPNSTNSLFFMYCFRVILALVATMSWAWFTALRATCKMSYRRHILYSHNNLCLFCCHWGHFPQGHTYECSKWRWGTGLWTWPEDTAHDKLHWCAKNLWALAASDSPCIGRSQCTVAFKPLWSRYILNSFPAETYFVLKQCFNGSLVKIDHEKLRWRWTVHTKWKRWMPTWPPFGQEIWFGMWQVVRLLFTFLCPDTLASGATAGASVCCRLTPLPSSPSTSLRGTGYLRAAGELSSSSFSSTAALHADVTWCVLDVFSTRALMTHQ